MQFFLKKFCHIAIILFSFSLINACDNFQPKLYPLSQGAVILAFGDSITYGTGATPETSYPAFLEKISGFKVINAGVPGDETANGIKRISQVLEENNPQLVIVCLGGNDLIHKRPEVEIKANLKKIIQIIKQTGAQIVLIAEPNFNLNLTIPEFYNELGKEFNIPVETTLFSQLIRKRELKSDLIHFNAAGYQAFAVAVAHFLKKQGAWKH